MIIGIIFSKDRALQLEACLTSFMRHVVDSKSMRLAIVYAASSPRLLGQYRELVSEHATHAEFVLEEDFRAQVLGAFAMASKTRGQNPISRVLRRSTPGNAEASECALFLVDDAIFVRPFGLAAAQEALLAHPEALGFSLRLGRNTTQSYVLKRAQRMPTFQNAGPHFLRFDWTDADGDFGYPLEISGSLYRLSTLRGLVRRLKFSDPNTLESQLSLNARRFARKHPLLLCPELSVAFSAPLNRVQDVYANRSSHNMDWSAERMADRFEDGLRLDVGALDGFVPAACHQEIEPHFIRAAESGR